MRNTFPPAQVLAAACVGCLLLSVARRCLARTALAHLLRETPPAVALFIQHGGCARYARCSRRFRVPVRQLWREAER